MISITQAAEELIKSDALALEALRSNLLNLSSYAEKIHKQVEVMTFKEVQKGTIVVALSRIGKKKDFLAPDLKPVISISNLSVKTSLSTITFNRTGDIERKVAVLYPFQIPTADIYSIIQGPTEISLVVSSKAKEGILKQFATTPKVEKENVVGITVEFLETHTQIPNFYFVLFSALSTKRIEIVGVLSTATEITFLVPQEKMEDAIKVLNVYFAK